MENISGLCSAIHNPHYVPATIMWPLFIIQLIYM
jgi:hypothetical protein